MDLYGSRHAGDVSGDESIDRSLEQLVRDGIERDERYTPEEVLEGIKRGAFQLFRYPKGIVVTQVTGHNRLLVFLLSGKDLHEWQEQATKDLRAFAQHLGIKIIEAYCRPGLEKMLKDVGWEKQQVVLRLTKTIRGANVRRPVF